MTAFQGAPGERGPKGDHGQHGETGAQGERGAPGTPGAPSRRLWPYVVVIVIAAIGGVAALDAKSSHDLRKAQRGDGWARYDSSLAACERGNKVRRQQVAIAKAQVTVTQEFATFLKSSAAFRRSQGEEALAKESDRSRAAILETLKTLNPPGQIVCVDVIDRPPYPRP